MLRFSVLCLWANCLTASPHFRVGNIGKGVSFSTEIIEGREYIEVRRSSRTILRYNPPAPYQRLAEGGIVAPDNESGPYLLTVWTRGPHSHTLLVFDLSLANEGEVYDTIVHSYTSAWEIVLSPGTRSLAIQGQVFKSGGDPENEHPVQRSLCRWEGRTRDRQFDCIQYTED